MSTLTIIFGVITLVLLLAVAAYAYRSSQQPRRLRAPPAPRQAAPARTAEKPAEPEPPQLAAVPEADDALSQSGMVSIQGEIDRCITAERWDEAIAWAQHAVDARPDNPEFKFKLAELYFRAGEREAFMQLFDDLKGKLGNNHELRRRLISMARKTMPERDAAPPGGEDGDA